MDQSTQKTPRQNRSGDSPSPNGRPKTLKKLGSSPKSPAGFELAEDGLYRKTMNSESHEPTRVWVSGPIKPIGFANDETGENWSLVVEFQDLKGRPRTYVLPRSAFAPRSGEAVTRPLLEAGLPLSAAKTAAESLRQYLMQASPSEEFLTVTKPGWYDGAFVLDDCTIGATRKIIYQPPAQSLLRVKGTLEDWIQAVAVYAHGNSRLQFAISVAFAAPLQYLINADSSVFHLRAGSRQGKTTLLIAAGSTCGGGGRLGYSNSWLMTSNAAELACAAHNDLLICLDELKLVDPKAAGDLAYMIASGLGKYRMTKTGASAPTSSWRTLGLSSGEISLHTHVRSAQQELYGGQLARFIEIPPPPVDSDQGLFDSIPHGHTPASFSDLLRRNARTHYGAPIQSFLAKVVARPDEHARDATKLVDSFVSKAPPDGAIGEIISVAQQMGLVVAGGILATQDGCTGWHDSDVWDAGLAAFRQWLDARGSLAPSDEERALRQVREAIATHAARFVSLETPDTDDYTTREQLGFRKEIDIKGETRTAFLVWPDAWAGIICRGLDPEFVAQVVRERGHLIASADNRLQYNSRIPGYTTTKRFYAVSETLLDNPG